jgi:UDP-glucose 4-epimerase
MSKAVITGGAGFIGSNLAELLVNLGWDVVVIDDLSHGSLENLRTIESKKNFLFVRADIREPKILDKHCVKTDCLVHLAAYKIPRYGDALKTLLVNNDGTKAVLDCASDNGIKTIIASTSDVYGKNPKPPFGEEDSLVLGSSSIRRWAYAASKIFDEHMAMAYYDERKLPAVILRFFGSYGPHNHRSWWGGPQAVFIEQALRNQPITVHGDGHQTRSFCYISDTINGIRLAMESNKAVGQIINIGSDYEIDIKTLAEMIIRMTKSNSITEYIAYESFGGRYEDVYRRIPNLSKAKELLGYQPMVSLEEGLARTINWHQAFA